MILIDLPDLVLRKVVAELPIRDQILTIPVLCRRMAFIQQSITPVICKQVKSLRIDCVSLDELSKTPYHHNEFVEFYQLGSSDCDLRIRVGVENTNDDNADGIQHLQENPYSVVFEKEGLREWKETKTKYDFTVHIKNLLKKDERMEIDDKEGNEGDEEDELGLFCKIFPNIEHLSVFITDTMFEILHRMLTYFPQLTHFNCFGLYHETETLKNLNSLKSLKHLSFELDLCDAASKLTILKQVEEFNCTVDLLNDSEIYYSQQLNTLIATKPNIRSLGLWIEYDEKYFDFNFNPEVIDRLHRITIGFSSDVTKFEWICSHWSCIRYFDFVLKMTKQTDFISIINNAALLTQLEHFNFAIENKSFNAAKFPLMHLTQDIINTLPRITSVKRFQFKFHLNPHQLHLLMQLFPNAEEIIWKLKLTNFDHNYGNLLCRRCQICHDIRTMLDIHQEHQNFNEVKLYIKARRIEKFCFSFL